MELMLPAGVVARPMSERDAGAVTALIAACELHVDGVAEVETADVEVNFGRPGFDASTDALVVVDGGDVVAWADVYKDRAEVDVHPSFTGRGVGRALLEWTERRASEIGTPVLRQVVSDANVAAARLFATHGYKAAHTSWILEVRFGDAPPEPPRVPHGITIRPFEPERDAEAAYRVVDDAFNEWEGRESVPFDEWAALTIRHPSFSAAMSPLAFEDGAELAGAAMCFDSSGDEGWIHQLATRATHRGRGIARALLETAFRSFYEAGKARAGLSTDSRTGALSLYERVGMRVRRSYTSYAKRLAAE